MNYKKPLLKKNLIFLISLAVLFVGSYFLVFQNKNTDTKRNTTKIETDYKKYVSKEFNFKLDIPKKFKIDEKLPALILKINNDEINITVNNTNYDNLDNYINTFDDRRGLNVISEENIYIKSYSTKKRTIDLGEQNQKAYFIYVNYQVYIFSTTSPELYDDLDQIAASFEYVGEE